MNINYECTRTDELKRIHESSLHILQETGVRIHSEKVLKRLLDFPVHVDVREKVVKIPSNLVEQSLATCPRNFRLYGRGSANAIDLHVDGDTYTRSTGGPEFILDPESGQRQPLTAASVAEYARLVDALPNIHYVKNVWPHDVPFNARDVHTAALMLLNTGKHLVVQPYTAASLSYIAEIVSVLADERSKRITRPLVSLYVSSTSPLQFDKDTAEMLVDAGEYGFPVFIDSTPLAGGTCPVTVAGMVVLINAEILAGLTIHQLFHPGAPVVYTPRPYVFDMSSGICGHGYVENALASVLLIHLAKGMYRLPIEILGPATDSKTVNLQSIFERLFLTMVPAFARPNLIAGAGNLESSSLISPIQLIIDDDLLGVMYRALRGVEINDETLALQQIAEVGFQGHYLQQDHTLRHFKEELYFSPLSDRNVREVWEMAGRKDLQDKAINCYRKLRSSHFPPLVEAEKRREVEAVLKRAANNL
jgi:trimethylamine--corrinoid protein Co-methyltransferase